MEKSSAKDLRGEELEQAVAKAWPKNNSRYVLALV